MHDLATLAADVCGLEAAVIHLGNAGSDAEVASAEVASAEVASAQGSGSGATGKGGAVATEGTDGDNSAAADAAAASALFGSGVRAWLAAGGVAVVPYDKDEANHMPALRGGRTAHYLIVFGVAQGAIAACAGEEAGGGWEQGKRKRGTRRQRRSGEGSGAGRQRQLGGRGTEEDDRRRNEGEGATSTASPE